MRVTQCSLSPRGNTDVQLFFLVTIPLSSHCEFQTADPPETSPHPDSSLCSKHSSTKPSGKQKSIWDHLPEHPASVLVSAGAAGLSSRALPQAWEWETMWMLLQPFCGHREVFVLIPFSWYFQLSPEGWACSVRAEIFVLTMNWGTGGLCASLVCVWAFL